MSGTAPLPQPPTTSLAWRVLRTPVSDLVCGRIEPLVDAERVIAAAALPAALADLAQRVVRRARLWRHERIEVARDLVAHFEDGLAAGVSADELAASFGDPVQAAKLFRRAVRRNRPWTWRAMKFTERAILTLVFGTVALALLVYGIQAARIYGGRVNVARNYAAEWNAPILAVPEAERAWPVYRAATLKMSPWPIQWDPYDVRPGRPGWAEYVAFLEANRDAVDLYRRAARMPRLAWLFSAGVRAEDAALYRRGVAQSATTDDSEEPPGPENPELISMLLTPAATLREAARTLALGAYRAAETGDAASVYEDVAGIVRVADHARELRFIIGDLLGAAVAHRACELLGTLLHVHPTLLTDDQLVSLAHRLSAVGAGSLQVRLDAERATFEDVLQRYYTDDGRGGGLPRPALLRLVADSAGQGTASESWRRSVLSAAVPALSVVVVGRHELRARYEYLFGRYEERLRTPLWLRRGNGVEPEIEALQATPWLRVRYAPLHMLLPALDRAFVHGDLAEQARDATLAAIALQLYHRRHGVWPATLDELTPQWLPQVPVDRFDGQPLRYRLVDGQPLLYSVGADRDDDGGRLPELPKLGLDAPRRRWQCNRAAMQWQPLPDPNQPTPAGCPDGDWLLWPPVLD